jgi:HAD superfamily hydrolase (TIGR01509 family)
MTKTKYENKAVLFDFDGVVVDTEPLYDAYWNEASVRYGLGIDNFAAVIKGTTMPSILEKYFSQFSDEFRKMVVRESEEFQKTLHFPLIPGVTEFMDMLKEKGIKIALVTSSEDFKLKRAFKILGFENRFDTVVSADRITKGKPDPTCYLLAAKDLGVKPEDCLVFEDSFSGIESGTRAGMRVIGLSTTNPEEKIKDKVYAVIHDFKNVTEKELSEWL